jgi:transcriptional regulator with XRE-family HTH domain
MSMSPPPYEARARLARNLRAWRAVRGLSQQQVAEHADLSRVYISQVERGLKSISVDTMERIAFVLSIDIAELLAPEHLVALE